MGDRMNQSQKNYIMFNALLAQLRDKRPDKVWRRTYRDRYKSGTLSVKTTWTTDSEDETLKEFCYSWNGYRFLFYGIPRKYQSVKDLPVEDQKRFKIAQVTLKLDGN
jgi:hypothetical protein